MGLKKKFQNKNNIQNAFQANDFPTVREETMNLSMYYTSKKFN